MDNTESIIVSLIQDEITHHGIVGMKWGVRRFQNKDGSLTAAGKKRVGQKSGSITETIKKKFGKKDKSEAPEKPKPKAVKDMTDDELRQKITRLQLEKQYRDLQPKETSTGKDIAKKFLNDAIVPAATNVGKQFLEKQLKNALGLNEKKAESATDKMKKKYDELKLMNDIHDQQKRQERNKAKDEAERKAKEEADAAAKQAKKDAKQAKKDAKAQKVVVEPLDKDYRKEDKSSTDYKTVWEYDYVPDSAKDTPYYSRETQELIVGGRQYITALLEEKN